MSDSPLQRIDANNVRAAGQNYYEVVAPSSEVISDQEDDERSLKSGPYFADRFAFEPWPQARAQFLEFRARHKLTLLEVRKLTKAGAFSADYDVFTVRANGPFCLAGWALFAVSSALQFWALCSLVSTEGPPSYQSMVELTVLGLGPWANWKLYCFLIWPFARLKC